MGEDVRHASSSRATRRLYFATPITHFHRGVGDNAREGAGNRKREIAKQVIELAGPLYLADCLEEAQTRPRE